MQEGSFEWYQSVFKSILDGQMDLYENQNDTYQLLLNMKQELTFNNKDVMDYAIKISKYAHEMAAYMAATTGMAEYDDLYWKFLLLEGQHYQVDSGLLYLEKNRVPSERFYEPRRSVFMQQEIRKSLPVLTFHNRVEHLTQICPIFRPLNLAMIELSRVA